MLSIPSMVQSSIEILPTRLAFVQWLYEQDLASQQEIILHREYYEGQQQTQLTDRQKAYLQLNSETEFNINLCQIVVDSPVERLNVTGFKTPVDVSDNVQGDDAPDDGEPDGEPQRTENDIQDDLLWEWWKADDVDKKQGQLYTAAGRDGVAFLLVGWDNDEKRPIFSVEEACADGIGAKVHYSDEHDDVIDFASKRWTVDKGPANELGNVRINLYYPDRIEKYITKSDTSGGNWDRFEVEGVPWPEPWLKKDGTPIGVSMIPFHNGDLGNVGRSDLADVIGPQNAVNKAEIDLIAVADLAGFPMLTFENGKLAEGTKIGPGTVLQTDGEGKFGKIPGEDLTSLIAFKDTTIRDIATVSRTPLSAFQKSGLGGAVAGEALKQEEAPLVVRVEKKQVDFGAAWEQVMRMARVLSNTFGGTKLDETFDIVAQWKQAQSRNELDHLRGLEAKERLGIPRTQIWLEAGYTPTEIADMIKSPEYAAYIAGLGMVVTDSDTLEAADAA